MKYSYRRSTKALNGYKVVVINEDGDVRETIARKLTHQQAKTMAKQLTTPQGK